MQLFITLIVFDGSVGKFIVIDTKNFVSSFLVRHVPSPMAKKMRWAIKFFSILCIQIFCLGGDYSFALPRSNLPKPDNFGIQIS